MIQRLLIANRGEVACRIISTCQRLGIETVAVYSEADRESLHVRLADQAVLLGPAPAKESYLNIQALLEAALRSGADAVHPGYGFLAENAEFAQRVLEAELDFVGPSPAIISQMGSKTQARALCKELDVPTIPGSQALNDEDLLEWAQTQDFPLMLKASAGGGGKGMRLLESLDALESVLASARRESLAAFGSDEVYLEKAIVRGRHIEVQVLADDHGNAVHLGLRECSLQRRHQKIVEESPPPNLSAKTAQQLTQEALKLTKAVGYSSLGTIEFLVEDDEIYFLEMNTRLQVEHPVTEMVTGLDLIELQLEVAEGHPLPIRQEQIQFSGHAIEARLTCEDPSNNFLPAIGTVLDWRPGPGVRVDTYVEPGLEISPHYDSMVGKVIAYEATRERALRKLRASLSQTVFLGIEHNINFLTELLNHPEVRSGHQHTRLVESLEIPSSVPSDHQRLAAAAVHWERLGGNLDSKLLGRTFEILFEDGAAVSIRTASSQDGLSIFTINDQDFQLRMCPQALEVDGHRFPVVGIQNGQVIWVHTSDGTARLQLKERWPIPQIEAASGSLVAPMPGRVVEVLVQVGDKVESGQTLMKLEAMKMEQLISSPHSGVVESISFANDDQVQAGDVLAVVGEG